MLELEVDSCERRTPPKRLTTSWLSSSMVMSRLALDGGPSGQAAACVLLRLDDCELLELAVLGQPVDRDVPDRRPPSQRELAAGNPHVLLRTMRLLPTPRPRALLLQRLVDCPERLVGAWTVRLLGEQPNFF